MNEAYNIIEENGMSNNAVIKVVGVGGGGGNMINHMIEKGLHNIELICANTDAQALQSNKAPIKIQLGKELTKGLGAGMKPEIGKEAAEESYDDIKRALDGADLVFVSAGMGGGTGTGAASVIAKIAKEIGALTIGVVTKPFRREGAKRAKLAEIGFNELKNECDSIVTIINQKLLSIIDRRASTRDAYKMVDDVLYQAVSGISGVIMEDSRINVDFADLQTVMGYKGMALMGIGHKTGENSAEEALKEAIESPLLDDTDIAKAKGILIHWTMNENYPLVDLDEAMESVFGDLMNNENITIIEGEADNNSLAEDEVKVTIIVTGFEDDKKPVNKTEKTSIPKVNLNNIRKIVGDDYIEVGGEELDTPTWLRNSRD